jgi:hypothetical protein
LGELGLRSKKLVSAEERNALRLLNLPPGGYVIDS